MQKNSLLLLFIFISTIPEFAIAQEYAYVYSIFSNSRMSHSYFYSKISESKGSTFINRNNKLLVDQDIFYTPGNSLVFNYVDAPGGKWSASIFKPVIRGQDHFQTATHLTFHLLVATSIPQSELPYVQLIYRDSSLSARVSISKSVHGIWQWIRFPLNSFRKINDVREIIGIQFSQKGNSGKQHLLYIDDIECISIPDQRAKLTEPEIISTYGYARHVDVEWKNIDPETTRFVKIYRSENGGKYHPVGVQYPFISRYADYTGETGKSYTYKISIVDHQYRESGLSAPASASTKAMTDEELLTMVQEASFRYYWDGAEKNSGLAKENIPGRFNMIASGASGFGIMALIVGTERKFITREQSVERFRQIVDFLDKAETFHGAFSHFIYGPTGKVEPFFGKKDNGGDLVETSFLMQGLLAARAYFKGNNEDEKYIREKITAIWQQVEWDWYKQFPDSKFLYWHWSPDQQWIINHPLIGWNETMVTYLLAIASPSHSVSPSMYYTGWASQEERAQKYRKGWGGTTDGSMYTNGNSYEGIKLDVGVSNGGPLFFTHYSYLGYDPHQLNDRYTNYFTNNQNIAKINYLYCLRNPNHFPGYGDSCWGLTASDGPYRYSADEPVMSRDHGKIAPTGAIASFPYLESPAIHALKNYYFNYGKFLWGEYGFRDAFNLSENWCSDIYMGLNQAPQVVMIENYRTSLIWNLFMSDPDIRNGLQKLADETGKRIQSKN